MFSVRSQRFSLLTAPMCLRNAANRDLKSVAAGTAANGDEEWQQHWLPHILPALLAPGESVLRDRVSTYILPGLLQMDDGALAALLRSLLPASREVATNEQVRVAHLLRDNGDCMFADTFGGQTRSELAPCCWLT